MFKKSDIQRMMMKHKKEIRDYEHASPELQAYWDMKDKTDEMILEQYIREEARAEALAELQPENFNVKFNSEVKIK